MEGVNISVQPSGDGNHEVKLAPHLFYRKYKLNDRDMGIYDREVRHLHYTGWPDCGVPDNDVNRQSYSSF